MSILQVNPLDAIKQNIENLLQCSKSLHRSKRFAISTHVSILCMEECSKYLIVYCKSHLPDKIFKKRFQHLNKHAVAGAPYFLSGQFSVVYMFHLAEELAEKYPGFGDIIKGLNRPISNHLFKNDPKTIAEAIVNVTEPQDAGVVKKMKQYYTDRENDRLNSVYVDISDDLKVTAGPGDFDKKKSREYLDRAELCRATVRFIDRPVDDITKYVEMLPVSERRKMKSEAMKNARKLMASAS